MGGGPRGRNVILRRGTLEPCISARPRPGFDRANFHVIVQTRAGPRACFRFLLMFIFRHPSISDEKIAALVETTETVLPRLSRAGSTVFSVLQHQLKSSAFKYMQ